MPDIDDLKVRLDSAETRYNRAVGGIAVLEEERTAELRRLLEVHGVDDYEALVAVREHLVEELATAEKETEQAFKDADL